MYEVRNHLSSLATVTVEKIAEDTRSGDIIVQVYDRSGATYVPSEHVDGLPVDRKSSRLLTVLRLLTKFTDGMALVGMNHLSEALGFPVRRTLARLQDSGTLRFHPQKQGGTMIVLDDEESGRLRSEVEAASRMRVTAAMRDAA